MTSPSDIAGLSERLEAMTAFAKELSDTLLSIRPLGGSECFVKRCGAYYADPDYFKGFIKRESDNRHEAMKCLVRERDRATRAEQQRDEAYERLKALVDADALAGVRKLVAGWNGEDRPEGPFNERHPDRLGATLPKTNCGAIYQLDDAMVDARAAIRRLASGPDGGSPLTAASDGEVKPSDSSGSEG